MYNPLLPSAANMRRTAKILILRGPTHQKWSNFSIFGIIVQFDPLVGAHLWEKNYGLGCIRNPQMGGEKSQPPLGKI